MLNAYQLRLKYKDKYLLKVASLFLDTLYIKKYSTFVLEIEWQAERVQKYDFIFDGKQ